MLQPAVSAGGTTWSDHQHAVLPECFRASGTVERIPVQAFPNEGCPKMAGKQSGIIRAPIWRKSQLLPVLLRVPEPVAFCESMRVQDREFVVRRTSKENQPGMWVCPSS